MFSCNLVCSREQKGDMHGRDLAAASRGKDVWEEISVKVAWYHSKGSHSIGVAVIVGKKNKNTAVDRSTPELTVQSRREDGTRFEPVTCRLLRRETRCKFPFVLATRSEIFNFRKHPDFARKKWVKRNRED